MSEVASFYSLDLDPIFTDFDEVTWSDVTDEVSNDRPLILSMENVYYEGQRRYHSVCVRGYLEEDIYQTVVIYETFDTSTHWISREAWGWAYITKLVDSQLE